MRKMMGEMTNSLGKLLRETKSVSIEAQYAGVLTPDQIPKAKETLANLERIIAATTSRNSCGTAFLRLSKRLRLLREQITRSESA